MHGAFSRRENKKGLRPEREAEGRAGGKEKGWREKKRQVEAQRETGATVARGAGRGRLGSEGTRDLNRKKMLCDHTKSPSGVVPASRLMVPHIQ